MKRKTAVSLTLAIVLVAGGGYWFAKKRAVEAKAAAGIPAAAAGPALASSSPVAAELASTDVLTLSMRNLAQGLPITGSLKAANSAFVKARVAGELQGLTVREGDFVKLGQILAKIDSSEFASRVKQAEDQAAATKAQIDIAQRQFDNNKALVDQGFISKTSLDTSLASLAGARATYQAALAGVEVAKKSVEDTVVRAPIAGQVSQRLAQPGERVGVDARIVEIVDLSRLEIEAAIATNDAANLRVGQTARVNIEGIAEPVQATIVRISPSAQAISRSVLTYLSVAPVVGLRQGLFAQGILGTSQARAVALPLTAVRTDKPQPYVQTLVNQQVVHATVVLGVRGDADGEPMVAIGGLPEGTQVLAGSLGVVREGTKVTFTQSVGKAAVSASAPAKP